MEHRVVGLRAGLGPLLQRSRGAAYADVGARGRYQEAGVAAAGPHAASLTLCSPSTLQAPAALQLKSPNDALRRPRLYLVHPRDNARSAQVLPCTSRLDHTFPPADYASSEATTRCIACLFWLRIMLHGLCLGWYAAFTNGIAVGCCCSSCAPQSRHALPYMVYGRS